MKIILTESQYKKVLLREFGETVIDPKEWYLRVLEWVDSSKDLDFETDEYEVVAYDKNGSYLGYYDKDQGFGFVVTEYGIGLEDKEENVVHGVYPPDVDGDGDRDADDASRCDYGDHCDYDGDGYIDEQEEGTGGSSSGNYTQWADVVSLVRGVANTLGGVPEVSPTRGPDNTLDNSPWSVSPERGPANELT